MSHTQYTATIKSELRALNREIDLKILKGLSYREEMHRHRVLLAKFRALAARRGIINRLFAF